jgi:hypothetical protein
MATTNLENQLHSAQKNLLFLQREHASTLKGLHAEIRRLQQHCTGASDLLNVLTTWGPPDMSPSSLQSPESKRQAAEPFLEHCELGRLGIAPNQLFDLELRAKCSCVIHGRRCSLIFCHLDVLGDGKGLPGKGCHP